MYERDVKRREFRFKMEERKRGGCETASDNAAGEVMKTEKNRENRFRAVRKPGGSTVEKEGANKGTVKEREGFKGGTEGCRG